MTGCTRRLGAPLTLLLLYMAAAPQAGDDVRAPAAADKTLIVGAVTETGAPIKDLTTEDFRLREDGVDREIVSVKPSAQPLHVVLLADTTKDVDQVLRDLRVSLSAFARRVHAVNPDAQISLMEFGQAAVTRVRFTTRTEDLENSINRLVAKPGAASVLLEGIIDASNTLSKVSSPRRAIVTLNLEPADEQSREDPDKIVDALRRSVAQLWSVSLQKGSLRNPKRDVVLNALTKNSGGAREFIVNEAALEQVLGKFADGLTTQYEVVYKRPDSARAKVVQVGTTRQGVKLHASGFAPQ